MKRIYLFLYFMFVGIADTGSDDPNSVFRDISTAWRLAEIATR
jgi:hypothetical protein